MPGKQKQTTNGPISNGTPPDGERLLRMFDTDDPEYIKDLQRPAVIKEDLSEMERRKRVAEILDSKPFRGALEKLILQEKEQPMNDENFANLEKLLFLPQGQLAAASLHSLNSHAIIPVADLRGEAAQKYDKSEITLRNRLASLYRLVDLFQWSQGIYNHITLRLPDSDHLLINPFGLLYHEITASSLVKIDLDGNIIDPGSTKMGINNAGYVLHSAVHRARPDVVCVIHMHTAVVAAVATMKCGLLPICQEAMILGPISYHDFAGIVDDVDERQSIADDLGEENKILLLRNHGAVSCGSNIEEALHLAWHLAIACETQVVLLRGTGGFIVCGESVDEANHLTRNLIQACDNQIRAARAGIENLVVPNETAVRRAYRTARESGGGGGVLKTSPGHKQIQWRVGELEWEAWMRVLDNAGFRTGHPYRQQLAKNKPPTSPNRRADIEAPPCASGVGECDESESDSLAAHRISLLKAQQEKIKWINSPNAYQKVEFYESGTDHPKKITKWVQDETSPTHSTPIKIQGAHQFAPTVGESTSSSNVAAVGGGVGGATASLRLRKEFKQKQIQIKEQRREGGVTSGPRSHVLEGVTYEELANKDADMSGTGEHIGSVLIGTASKGIIERDFQHNAQVYRQLYAPNPFASETDEDIQKYLSDVRAKSTSATPSKGAESAGEPTAPSPAPDSTSVDVLKETSFDAAQPTTASTGKQGSEPKPSSENGRFSRSKSDRFQPTRRTLFGGKGTGDDKSATAVRAAVSDDEAADGRAATLNGSGDKKKEKKKKRSFFSFGKSKEKKAKEKEKSKAV